MKRLPTCVLLAASMLCGCGGGATDPPTNVDHESDQQVAFVTIEPGQATVLIGRSVSLLAKFSNEGGEPVPGGPVTWSTSDPTVAAVSTVGSVTAIATGSADITAEYEGKRGVATINVENPAPSIEELDPTATWVEGQDFVLSVQGEGFVSSSVVLWDGSERPTTYVGPHEIQAAIGQSDLASARDVPVTVTTPGPGGGAAGTSPFQILSRPPGQIAFGSDRGGVNGIYLMNADGTDLGRLGIEPNWLLCIPGVWAPDGSGLARSSDRDLPGKAEIYLLSADGSGESNLTSDPADDFHPAWSPDGSTIVFASDREGTRDIYVMDRHGSVPERLTTGTGNETYPQWSPDGTRIVYVQRDSEGDSDLYAMNPDGSDPQRLTHYGSVFNGGWVTWSPDGTMIAFLARSPGGKPGPYVMNADGTDPRRLVHDGAIAYGTSWSPDGSRIVFEGYLDGGSAEIYTVRVDGTGIERLTQCQCGASDPAWSPDGEWIVYTTETPEFGLDVFVMKADGSAHMNLTRRIGSDWRPTWRPIP